MSKLKIYHETKESEVFLKLEEGKGGSSGDIFVIACDRDGSPLRKGYLPRISKKGFFPLVGVSKSLGFSLDSSDRLRQLIEYEDLV